jgi:hypothetical protein
MPRKRTAPIICALRLLRTLKGVAWGGGGTGRGSSKVTWGEGSAAFTASAGVDMKCLQVGESGLGAHFASTAGAFAATWVAVQLV